jgi:outer membrane autotransporter protein
VINMINGIENDRIVLKDSDFIGGGAVGVDAFLGGPGSTADVLAIGGTVFANGDGAPTALVVNDTNAGGLATYNPVGIEVVDVSTGNTAVGDFFLEGGPIDKGFFTYDLALRPDNIWVLRNSADHEAFEAASVLSAQQNAWYATTGAWHQRTVDLRQTYRRTAITPSADLPEIYAPAPAIQANSVGGVWGRAIGDWAKYDASHGVKYNQDTYGFQAGADVGFSLGDGTLVVGVMGGYIKSDVDYKKSPTKVDFEGGSVGGYLTYLQGGFYFDALVKADLMTANYRIPTVAGHAKPDANTIGASFEMGYRFEMGGGAYIEPEAQLTYVSAKIDDINIHGVGIDWKTGESLRGRFGARLGTSILADNGTRIEPYVKASVVNEFDGNNKVNVGGFLTADKIDGTWGEAGAGVQLLGAGPVAGFLDGTAVFGKDVTGGMVTGGIRFSF